MGREALDGHPARRQHGPQGHARPRKPMDHPPRSPLVRRPEGLPARAMDGRISRRPSRASPIFPFGGGARSCIGENFAWAEMVLVLATIAARWKLAMTPEAAAHPAAAKDQPGPDRSAACGFALRDAARPAATRASQARASAFGSRKRHAFRSASRADEAANSAEICASAAMSAARSGRVPANVACSWLRREPGLGPPPHVVGAAPAEQGLLPEQPQAVLDQVLVDGPLAGAEFAAGQPSSPSRRAGPRTRRRWPRTPPRS